MKKIIFSIIIFAIVPFVALACVPPASSGYTSDMQCAELSTQMSAQYTSTMYDLAMQNCHNSVAQYQAAVAAYQNCLSATPVVVQNSSSTAPGSIQLLNFPSQLNATVNKNFSVVINYVYSGSNYTHVSIVGTNLPQDLELGSVTYGNNGVDNITLSGIPTQTGDYPLTLVVTDNNGALVNQSFDLKVNDICSGIPVSGALNPVVFTDDAQLPDATVGQLYSQRLIFTFSKNLDATLPAIGFCSSDGLTITPASAGGSGGNGSAGFTVTPKQSGQFKITAYAMNGANNGNEVGVKTFNLTVNSPNNIAPVVPPQTTNQNVVPPVTKPAPVAVQQPITKPSTPPVVKNIVTEKTSEPAPTVNNVPEQNIATPPAMPAKVTTPAATPKKSMLEKAWDFIKGLFGK